MKTYKRAEPGFICEHGLNKNGACGDPAGYALSGVQDWNTLPAGDRFLCEKHLSSHASPAPVPVVPVSEEELLRTYLEEVEKNG